ncbi:ABC transporter permease [Limoniibacter endophyticus]|uniref:Sugar ABC transporter permease n=1 Tax=Limoniibacter endophyticus TaxID=1565040 RepID=A0A8J3DI67_9HYPH|nr:ABC transporter permease [Limoniibacter endophyticus]GHC70375.1 sugar ABC transporter permease [Limoniibacter endophyticus]
MSTLRQQPFLITLAVLAVLLAVNTYLQPSFLTPGALQSNLTTFLPLVLVAIGQTYVILAADIDLSIGAVVALVNVTVVTVITAMGDSGTAMLIGMGAGVLVGAACGLLNGFFVAVLRFQPIVTTFATGIIFSGLAIWVLPQAGLGVPEAYWMGYSGFLLGLPTVLWIFLTGLIFTLIATRTVFHAHLLAVGGNRTGAFQTGLRSGAIRIGAYVISGIFASLAALCLVGETASGDPLLGPALTLSSVSAVVLGGTALSGGFGTPLGSLFGALVLGMIGNVIFFAGLPFEYQTLVQGLIVLAALAGGVFVTRR